VFGNDSGTNGIGRGRTRYREYAPCEALREYIRAFFTFTSLPSDRAARRLVTREILFDPNDPFCGPLFADGDGSIVFSFGTGYRVDGLWNPGPSGPRGHVIGPILAGRTAWPGERFDTFGAYFRPAQARLFVPAGELTDRIVALEDVWSARELENQLGEARGDADRLEILEAGLLRRLAEKPAAINLPALAAFVHQKRGQVTVQHLADAAGVSRQHLARTFRESTGVTPKMYCRLARFRASLAYAGGGAGMAADLGYFDQSHMIAEFKEFSGLTPGTLTAQRYFHPFA
jgi:AraC-like DNA-binding protein